MVTGNNHEEVYMLKEYLTKEFKIKDLKRLRYFLGIEAARLSKGIFIFQRKYILDILAKTNPPNCEGEVAEKGTYQRLVGRLIYLSHTLLHIAYSVSIINQFMHDPHKSHLDVVYRILKCLKSAPGKGLLFPNNGHLKVKALIDVDWVGSLDDRKSTSEIGGNLVS
jgi:hypothetical protein